MIVSGKEVVDWVMDSVGGSARPNATAIGFLRNGKIIAGHVFEGWNGVNVFTHVRIEEMPSKFFFGAIADYIFNTLKCSRATGFIEEDNPKAVKYAEHSGANKEGSLKGAGSNGGDVIIFVMKRENVARWLNVWNKKVINHGI